MDTGAKKREPLKILGLCLLLALMAGGIIGIFAMMEQAAPTPERAEEPMPDEITVSVAEWGETALPAQMKDWLSVRPAGGGVHWLTVVEDGAWRGVLHLPELTRELEEIRCTTTEDDRGLPEITLEITTSGEMVSGMGRTLVLEYSGAAETAGEVTVIVDGEALVLDSSYLYQNGSFYQKDM